MLFTEKKWDEVSRNYCTMGQNKQEVDQADTDLKSIASCTCSSLGTENPSLFREEGLNMIPELGSFCLLIRAFEKSSDWSSSHQSCKL